MYLQVTDFDPALLIVFAVPLFALLVGLLAIYWDHKRKMKMIDEGLVPGDEDVFKESDSWWVLAVGLLLTAVGVGMGVESYLRQEPIEGVVVFLLGVAALIYFVVKKSTSTGDSE